MVLGMTGYEATDAACCGDVDSLKTSAKLIQRPISVFDSNDLYIAQKFRDTSTAHSSYNPRQSRGNKGDKNNSAYVISAPAVFAPWPTFL